MPDDLFAFKFHYGGYFGGHPQITYIGGKVKQVDNRDPKLNVISKVGGYIINVNQLVVFTISILGIYVKVLGFGN